MTSPSLTTGTWTPCPCPEAGLLRQVLHGQIPAADTPTWAALLVLVEAAAARRVAVMLRRASLAVSTATDWAATADHPTHAALVRRRYPPDGDVHRWIAHHTHPCPAPPCPGPTCPHTTTSTRTTTRTEAA